jgi:hypothetical protein
LRVDESSDVSHSFEARHDGVCVRMGCVIGVGMGTRMYIVCVCVCVCVYVCACVCMDAGSGRRFAIGKIG